MLEIYQRNATVLYMDIYPYKVKQDKTPRSFYLVCSKV